MAFVEWDPALEVGHGQLDADHQALVAALNSLQAAVEAGMDQRELDRALAFLRDYTVSHFAEEERLMLQHRYPRASAHFAAHSALLIQVSDLRAAHRAGQADLTSQVVGLLGSWLQDHIQGEDKVLGAFLKTRGPEARA